jgi:hypothetical protein
MAMSSERPLDIHCQCGAVHLHYQGAPFRHFVCHCKHCQTSMAWLESQGGTSSRHASGGDQTLFVHSDDLRVVTGEDQLGVYSVIARVRTPRVYARCCHTALASTFHFMGRFTAIKTVGVRNKQALPALQEHINVASAPSPVLDDGLPQHRGMGLPLIGRTASELSPFGSHRSHRWVQRSPSDLIVLETVS